MWRVVRENALCAFMAGAGSATIAWLGLYGFAWSDYESEAKPAFDALTDGHVLEFLRLAPAYGGSLVERTPFALLPGLWGGGTLAVYRMVALPCLLAAAALAVWLCARMRATSSSRLARAVTLGVCVANPLTLEALELGHPEELLGACLCVGAVLLAGGGRPIWAGVLLGLAIANKEWALLAVGPVLLALPRDAETSLSDIASSRTKAVLRARALGRRRVILCLTSTCAVAAAVLAPLMLVSSGRFAANTSAVASSQSAIFQPWQVWWFFGWHGPLVHGLFGVPKLSYRTGPAWASEISHPLIVVVGFGLAAALWMRRRRRAETTTLSVRDALLTLALVLLARCVLDTWDTTYYALPFVVALLSWEMCGESAHHPPLLALMSTILAWESFQGLPAQGASPDTQAALFLAWTLPLGAMLALRLYAPRRGTGLIRAPVELPPVLGEKRSSSPWATSI
jgi:hypothetical protein